jgi:riboflavin synthase
MFTGIIEKRGKVLRVSPRGQSKSLSLEISPDLTGLQLGDSINVNGACLTVVEIRGQTIDVDLSSETLQKTTLGDVKQGDGVNLERALRLSDRLGGHIVTGHIDATGTIVDRREEREFLHLRVRIPGALSKYVVQKGSIAIDGVSLTVNDCREGEIQLTLIPYTLQETTLVEKRVGDRVNVETDILAKYVERLLGKGESGTLSSSFLREHGFIKGE